MSNSRNDVRQRFAYGRETETYILPDVFVVSRFGHRTDGKRNREYRSSKGQAPDRIYGNRHFRHARRHIATGIQEPSVGWTYARFLYFNTIICSADRHSSESPQLPERSPKAFSEQYKAGDAREPPPKDTPPVSGLPTGVRIGPFSPGTPSPVGRCPADPKLRYFSFRAACESRSADGSRRV